MSIRIYIDTNAIITDDKECILNYLIKNNRCLSVNSVNEDLLNKDDETW